MEMALNINYNIYEHGNPQSVLGILNDHSFVKTRVDTHMHLLIYFPVIINDRVQFILTIKYAAQYNTN